MLDKSGKLAFSDREIFAVFFKIRSVKQTADFLGTYPSTVSRSIRSLENHLNVKLLGKVEGRISLTQDGLEYGTLIEKKIEEIRNLERNLSIKLIEIDIIATEWLLNNVASPAIPEEVKKNQSIRINFISSATLNCMKAGKPTIFIGSARENKKANEMLLKNISNTAIAFYAPISCSFINFNKIYGIDDIKKIPFINVVDGNMLSVVKFEGHKYDNSLEAPVTVDAFHTAFKEGMSRKWPFVSSHCVMADALADQKCLKIKTDSNLQPIFIDVIFSKSDNGIFLDIARSIHEYGKEILSCM